MSDSGFQYSGKKNAPAIYVSDFLVFCYFSSDNFKLLNLLPYSVLGFFVVVVVLFVFLRLGLAV